MKPAEAIHPYIYVGLTESERRHVSWSVSLDDANARIILLSAESVFNTTQKEVEGRARKRNVCLARFAIIKILRDRYHQPYSAISPIIKRDHSSCIHGLKSFNNDIENIEAISELYYRFEQTVKRGLDPTRKLETVGAFRGVATDSYSCKPNLLEVAR